MTKQEIKKALLDMAVNMLDENKMRLLNKSSDKDYEYNNGAHEVAIKAVDKLYELIKQIE